MIKLLITDFWLWQFLGRLHPLMVHFPIGLLILALIFELVSWRKKDKSFQSGTNIVLIIGAASAVLSCCFGLLLKSQDDYNSDTLTIHQWTGIATAVLAFGALYFFKRSYKQNEATLLNVYRSFLIFSVVGVTLAGHYGASLTHGVDYLNEVLPGGNEDSIERDPNFNLASFSSEVTNKPLDDNQVTALNIEVRSIFAHNCYKCHSAEKTKGELRLDRKDFVMRGGKSGEIIIAGQPEQSEIIRRLHLPRTEKESMPPKGKTLTEKEIKTLELWIKLGAPWPEITNEKSVYRIAELAPRMPTLPADGSGLSNPIDKFVNVYFNERKFSWPSVVDDRTYIRRVFLDIIGLLPTPEKINAFISDNHPDKRELLVKELLDRNDDYAQHWLSFWNDALRNDYTGTGYITGGRFDITAWLYESKVISPMICL
jgi:uncharacterized membrane protein/mono/diheme cytochrome c family protein